MQIQYVFFLLGIITYLILKSLPTLKFRPFPICGFTLDGTQIRVLYAPTAASRLRQPASSLSALNVQYGEKKK
jgi:hypothetical protein